MNKKNEEIKTEEWKYILSVLGLAAILVLFFIYLIWPQAVVVAKPHIQDNLTERWLAENNVKNIQLWTELNCSRILIQNGSYYCELK